MSNPTQTPSPNRWSIALRRNGAQKEIVRLRRSCRSGTTFTERMGMVPVRRMGSESSRAGIVAITNSRVILFTKKLGGYDVEDFSYAMSSSVECHRVTPLFPPCRLTGYRRAVRGASVNSSATHPAQFRADPRPARSGDRNAPDGVETNRPTKRSPSHWSSSVRSSRTWPEPCTRPNGTPILLHDEHLHGSLTWTLH
jgi:hypothetical protein